MDLDNDTGMNESEIKDMEICKCHQAELDEAKYR